MHLLSKQPGICQDRNEDLMPANRFLDKRPISMLYIIQYCTYWVESNDHQN